MITGTSAAFTAQTEGVEQVAAWRLQMTLAAGPYSDVSLAVDHVSINASTTSDMPEGTRLEVGYPAMSCTFTLSGLVDLTDESKTAGWLFGPYQATSPLYYKDALYAPVTVDIGLNTDNNAGTTTQGTPEYVRKFTGYVDDYVVNDDGSVTFTCIEQMRQQLRGAAQLPPLLNVPVTAEYLIDYMLRADTAGAVSSWPPRLLDSLLAVGFRTATLPETGLLLQDYSPTYAPGVFGSALAGGALKGGVRVSQGGPNFGQDTAVEYTLAAPYVLGNDSTNSPNLAVEFWVNGDVSTVFPSVVIATSPPLIGGWASSWYKLTVKSTGLEVSGSLFATQTWSTSVSSGPHHVSWVMSSDSGAGTFAIAVELDGVTHTFATVTAAHGTLAQNYVAVGWSGPAPASTIEALQVSANTAGAPVSYPGYTTSYPFTPKAVLNPSLNANLNVIGAADGDTYSVIQQLVQAELAVAGGDESAVFRFYNRDTIASAQPVRTITSAASLKAVGGAAVSAASVVNHCTVDWTAWTASATATNIYTATDPIRIPAGQTVTLKPTLGAPARLYGNVPSGTVGVIADGNLAAMGFGARYSTTKAGTAAFNPNLITRKVVQTASDQLQITFTNNGSTDCWLVSSAGYLDVAAGTPVLQIAGYTWTADTATVDYQYPPVAADGSGGAASSRFGDQGHQISGNPWIQDFASATLLAQDIVVDQCTPRPNLTGVAIVPDPRLQTVDVVRIQDPDVTGMDEYARIFGWTLNWDTGSFEMTVDARTLAAPGGWIMGVAGRSEIGSTAYVYPST